MSFRSRTRATGVFYVPGFPKGVKWLLISNVIVFLISFFLQLLQLDGPVRVFLALTPQFVVKYFFIWQLATYMFLHQGFGHIIWNMLALWMFGADLEKIWGTRRFLQFYFFCGIGAGFCVVALNYLLPWGSTVMQTVGSSGAIFGILMACAMLFPDRPILFGFIFPMQMKWFVLIVGVIAFLGSFQVNSGVSAFAHLGGLLFGYFFLKTPNLQFDLLGPIQRQYKDYKLRRARKKFQVYLNKQGSGRGPTIH
jgi:membrane associated rhomboid family serine protease